MQLRPSTGTRTTQQRLTSLMCLLALLVAPLLLCLSTPAHAMKGMSMGHAHCSQCVHHAPPVQIDAQCCAARQQPPASTAVASPEIASPFNQASALCIADIATPSAALRRVTATTWHAPPLISLRI